MVSKLFRLLLVCLACVSLVVLLVAGVVYAISYHPHDIEPAEVACAADAPELPASGKLKVLNWNIQYMASTNYVFWYDMPANAGPDARPAIEDVRKTIPEVARIIQEENPDVVLLQEMQEDAVQSHHINNLTELLKELPGRFPCVAQAFYWKSGFVPVPQIMGRTDMKLVTLSRYKIAAAQRHQLALIPGDPISQQLGLKRAVLTADLPVAGGTRPLVVLNTHLDAFGQGTDTLARQVEQVRGLLEGYSRAGQPFLIAGDFNMLPPRIDPNSLDELSRQFYNPRTEITPLFDAFPAAPDLNQLTGPGRAAYFTHIANYNRKTVGADRTIDFYFYSPLLKLADFRVRGSDTKHISDHLPMIADFQF